MVGGIETFWLPCYLFWWRSYAPTLEDAVSERKSNASSPSLHPSSLKPIITAISKLHERQRLHRWPRFLPPCGVESHSCVHSCISHDHLFPMCRRPTSTVGISGAQHWEFARASSTPSQKPTKAHHNPQRPHAAASRISSDQPRQQGSSHNKRKAACDMQSTSSQCLATVSHCFPARSPPYIASRRRKKYKISRPRSFRAMGPSRKKTRGGQTRKRPVESKPASKQVEEVKDV